MTDQYTTVSYFFQEDYKNIKPNRRPSTSTDEQVKLKPVVFTEEYRWSKEFQKIKKWHKEHRYDIQYFFKKCLNIFKVRKILINYPPNELYSEFTIMLYYKFHDNIYLKS